MNLQQLEKDLGKLAPEISCREFERWMGFTKYYCRETYSRRKNSILKEYKQKYGDATYCDLCDASIQKVIVVAVQSWMFSGFEHLASRLEFEMEDEIAPDSFAWYAALAGAYLLWSGFSFQEMSDLNKSDISNNAPLLQKGDETVLVPEKMIRFLRKFKNAVYYKHGEKKYMAKHSDKLFRSYKSSKVPATMIEQYVRVLQIDPQLIWRSGAYWRKLLDQSGATTSLSDDDIGVIENNTQEYEIWKKVFYPDDSFDSNWVNGLAIGELVITEEIYQGRMRYRKEEVVSIDDQSVQTVAHVFSKNDCSAMGCAFCNMLNPYSKAIQSLFYANEDPTEGNCGVAAIVLGELYRSMLADGSGDNRVLNALQTAIFLLNKQSYEKKF